MDYKQFENIKVRIYWEEDYTVTMTSLDSEKRVYKGKVLFEDRPSIQFFSVNSEKLNDILKGFETLDKYRFGRAI